MADYLTFEFYSTLHGIRAIRLTSPFFLPFFSQPHFHKHYVFINRAICSHLQHRTSFNPPYNSTPSHHNKLTRENYLLWKAQVVPYLCGQHLFQFVDGSSPIPQPIIAAPSDGASTTLINPKFTQWQLQDQIMLSALISSLSEKVIAHVVKCTTSRDLWATLERMFTA